MANKRVLEIRPEFIPVYSILNDAVFQIVIICFVLFYELLIRYLTGEFSFVVLIPFVVFILLFCLAGIVYAYLRHMCTVYTIYDDRIEFKQGILNTNFSSIKLKNIREIHLRESFMQRIWHLGTLRFITSANDSFGTGVCFVDIKYPDRAYARIKSLIDNTIKSEE